MHLLRAIPNAGKYLEFAIEGADYYPWQEGLFVETPYAISDGHATVTDAPGWGVEISPEWLARSIIWSARCNATTALFRRAGPERGHPVARIGYVTPFGRVLLCPVQKTLDDGILIIIGCGRAKGIGKDTGTIHFAACLSSFLLYFLTVLAKLQTFRA